MHFVLRLATPTDFNNGGTQSSFSFCCINNSIYLYTQQASHLPSRDNFVKRMQWIFLLLYATIGGLLLQAQVGKHTTSLEEYNFSIHLTKTDKCSIRSTVISVIIQLVHDYIIFFFLPVEVQSYNYPDYYISRSGSAGYIQRRTQPVQWRLVTPGLCGLQGTVSLQLSADPNVYLRDRGFLLYADPFQDSGLFRNDACFFLRKNKWYPGCDAYESVIFPGRFIRHQGFRLQLHPYESVAIYEQDSSFRIIQPICHKIQSANFPRHYFRLTGDAAYIKENSVDRFILISPGLTGHAQSVSFRLCSDATKYLRHTGFKLHAHSHSPTEIYKKDGTFTIRKDKWLLGFDAFESVNFPGYFIRHQGFRLNIHSYDGAWIYKNDASFKALRWLLCRTNIDSLTRTCI